MDAHQLKEWLCEELEKRPEKSKAELAKALNLEPPAVSKILNGTRQIKATEYVRILEFLGVEVNEKGIPDPTPFTENTDGIESGLHEKRHDSGQWSIPQEIIGRKKPEHKGTHQTFCINDTLMEPDFRQGEHVLIDGVLAPSAEPQPFLVSDGYSRMIRLCRLIPESRPKTVEITARSKSFEAQQLFERDFEIIGKVVAKLDWI